MVIACDEVLREMSNYLDGEVDAALRAEIESHVANCRHCAATLDTLHNTIVIMCDERTFSLPAGFSQRLRARLAAEMAAG